MASSAKAQAGEVVATAQEQVATVVERAKEETAEVAEVVSAEARAMVETTRSELETQAETQISQIAESMHRGQFRKSGDPYITHPLAVTTILADIGMTEPTLVAALLHDTVEDTSASLDEVRETFGDPIAGLVDGVTKLTEITFHASKGKVKPIPGLRQETPRGMARRLYRTYLLLAQQMSQMEQKPDLAVWANSIHRLIREGSQPSVVPEPRGAASGAERAPCEHDRQPPRGRRIGRSTPRSIGRSSSCTCNRSNGSNSTCCG